MGKTSDCYLCDDSAKHPAGDLCVNFLHPLAATRHKY